jgi:hydrogenase expression/formation protein HypC
MCLGVPGQVVSLDEPSDGLVMGKVSFGGVEREVCFGYASEAKLGDYVLVHVGFAIAVLDETEAQRILEDFEAIARINAAQDADLDALAARETS